jgi:hypothetical protein
MAKKKNIKLTEHISYCIIDSTIYLFQKYHLNIVLNAFKNKINNHPNKRNINNCSKYH